MSNQIAYTRYFDSNADLIAFLGQIGEGAPGTTEKPAKAAAEKPAKAAAEKPAKAETKKPSVTQAQMQAALQEVKEKFGVPEAKAIINEAGGVKKMDEIAEDKYEAVFKACQEKLNEEADEGSDDDGI